MNQEDQLTQLMKETQRRKRLKTDLSQFDDKLKEMMRLDISLPVIVDWLSEQGKATTLQALRRYVKRIFGEDHYDNFVKRNGWSKTKSSKVIQKTKLPINSFDERQKSSHNPANLGDSESSKEVAGVSEIHKVLNTPLQKYPVRKK
jgi:tRNA U38,U39,U40 pseudouridine synthase TruA